MLLFCNLDPKELHHAIAWIRRDVDSFCPLKLNETAQNRLYQYCRQTPCDSGACLVWILIISKPNKERGDGKEILSRTYTNNDCF